MIDMNKLDFAYLIGAMLGDGWISKENRLFFCVKDEEFIQQFVACINRCFDTNLKYTFYFDKYHRKYFHFRTRNKEITIKLKKAFKNFDKVLKTKKEIRYFIRGFFDAEGSISKYKIAFHNSNLKIIKYIQRELLKLRFNSHLGKIEYKDGRKIEYRIWISKSYFKDFFYIIKPTISRKRKRLLAPLLENMKLFTLREAEFIRNHWKKDLTVHQIADHLNRNPGTMKRVCRLICKYQNYQRIKDL